MALSEEANTYCTGKTNIDTQKAVLVFGLLKRQRHRHGTTTAKVARPRLQAIYKQEKIPWTRYAQALRHSDGGDGAAPELPHLA